ncbi:hypothetical protein [Falsirhodobacter xinxiangensis]|uniref:hypothetical protein n=1 Tax=Falsirhodobacter xinxiangensis TaxID=2530049 RepID=UPI0010AA8E3C|nr:hypothetical protein [Rhodobacter xinxiangensis]
MQDQNQPGFEPAPDLSREGFEKVQANPLPPEVASQIEGQLRGIDSVNVRVLGDDPSAGHDIAAHLAAKGFAVDVTLAERMIPHPLSRHVFRFQGRTAILTVAPDLP